MKNQPIQRQALAAILATALTAAAGTAQADETSQAYRLHRRIAGVNPSPTLLEQMRALLKAGKPVDAALVAIDNDEQSFFYNITLKKFFGPWFDEDGYNSVPLNDGIALLIGMTRDEKSFQQIFSSNLAYVGAGFSVEVPEGGGLSQADRIRLPESTSNLHYEAMEREGVDLKKYLTPIRQTDVVLDPTLAMSGRTDVPAGLYTTRAWAQAYYIAGTNRAPFRFTLKNFLCQDIDSFHDTTVPDDEVRRDPDRAPGGDSAVYNNKCKGCHAGMDPMSRAFAYVDWDDVKMRLKYTKPKKTTPWDEVQCAEGSEVTLTEASGYEEKLRCAVVKKYMNNKHTYPQGYIVKNDHWKNFWTGGNNARVGWPAARGEVIEGEGPKDLGIMMTSTRQFPVCMAQQVMKHVCLAKDFENAIMRDRVKRLADGFVKDGFNMKRLFAETAATCMGGN